MTDPTDLTGRVAAVTGAAGLLGGEHLAALGEAGAALALIDVDAGRLAEREGELGEAGHRVQAVVCDITSQRAVDAALADIVDGLGRLDVLVNNAARNPKVEDGDGAELSRMEHFPDAQWDADLAVGLTGAYRCSRAFGAHMASSGGGVILNIASDLGVIAPDQRLYEVDGRDPADQPVKPVTYSVVKHGLVGLTRYLATYWAQQGVRCNALSPGGVAAGQPAEFVERLEERIPLGRMARPDEYRAAVRFLCSDASSYMTGQNVVMDGGRSTW